MGKLPIMLTAHDLISQRFTGPPQVAPSDAIAAVEDSLTQFARISLRGTDELLLLQIACNALRVQHSPSIDIGQLPNASEPSAPDSGGDSPFAKLSAVHLQRSWVMAQISRAKPEHSQVFLKLAESSQILKLTCELLQHKFSQVQNGALPKPALKLGGPLRVDTEYLNDSVRVASFRLKGLFPDLIPGPAGNFDPDFGRLALWATKNHSSLFHSAINKSVAIHKAGVASGLSPDEHADRESLRILYQILLGQGLEAAALTIAQEVTRRFQEIESSNMALSLTGTDVPANLAKVLQLDGIAWWYNLGSHVYTRREQLLENLIGEETLRSSIANALRTLVFVRAAEFDNYPFLTSTSQLQHLMKASVGGLEEGNFPKLVAYHLGLCWILPKTVPVGYNCGLPPPPESLEAVYPYALDALGLLSDKDRGRLSHIKLGDRQKMAIIYPTAVSSFKVWVDRLQHLGVYSDCVVEALEFMSSALGNYSVPCPFPLPPPLANSWKDPLEPPQPTDSPIDPQSKFAPAGWVPFDYLVKNDDDFSPESLRFALSYLEHLYPDQHGHFYPLSKPGRPGRGRKGHFFSPNFVLSLRQLLATERFLRAEHKQGVSIWPS